MKIEITAWQLAPEVTGTDRFAYNVLRELQAIDGENSYQINCRHGNTYIPAIVTAPNFRVVYHKRARRSDPLALPWHVARSIRRRRARPDLFFSFHNFSLPLLKACPTVVSALDFVPLAFPEQYHPRLPRRVIYRELVRKAVRDGDHFVAISEFTKSDLVNRFDVDPERITVVRLAAEPVFRPVDSREAHLHVRERYALPDRFILTMGSTEPRKNVVSAVRAYERLPPPLKEEVALVVTGNPWHGLSTASWGIEERARIHFAGYVDHEDMPTLYSSADVFVFPSLYEGFGMPPLEAMACGTPVVCSNATSLPEVAEGAALMVDPLDVEAMSAALERALQPEIADELRRRGLARAATFSWESTARCLLDIFREVANGGRARAIRPRP